MNGFYDRSGVAANLEPSTSSDHLCGESTDGYLVVVAVMDTACAATYESPYARKKLCPAILSQTSHQFCCVFIEDSGSTGQRISDIIFRPFWHLE